MGRAWLYTLAVLLMICMSANAIYEHEVGRNDWAVHTLGGDIYDAQASESHPSLIFTVSQKILSAVTKAKGTIVWRKELPESTTPFVLDVIDHFVMVQSQRDIMIFEARSGELISALNSQNTISDAQFVVSKDGKAPTVVYSEREGSTYSYRNAKKQATEEKSYVALGTNSKGELFGLRQEGGSYTLYSLNPNELTSTKVKSGISLSSKAGSNLEVRSNRNYFVIIEQANGKLKGVDKVTYEGRVESESNVNQMSHRDLTLAHDELHAPHSKHNNLGMYLDL